MSIVSLPFQYEQLEQLQFEDYLEKSQDVQTTMKRKLFEYRLKIFPLLLAALQTEIDVVNVQYLFGVIRLACSLAAYYERQRDEADFDNRQVDPAVEYMKHAVIAICERGTNDSQLFLAALDTLTSIVTDPICQLPTEIWKGVLKRLCTFIDMQLHRGPKDHTREMHSTCVAAYNTLMTIITERPTLLDDHENLFKLSEIIELGISGEKAQTLDGIMWKKEKELHPASQRVAEAAEYLMFVLFEHKAVLHLKNDICRNGLDESIFENFVASSPFKYFAINGNTICAMNELPIHLNNGMPAIILLCRGLFGKSVWTSNFRHNPISNPPVQLHRLGERTSLENGKTPSPRTPHVNYDLKDKPIITQGVKTERAKSELSIPTLSSIIKRDEEKLNLFRTLKAKQIPIEEEAIQRARAFDEKPLPECQPPESRKHFESIRLFLSHYGFCSLDSIEYLKNGKHWEDSKQFSRHQPRIQPLDSNVEAFMDDIKKLDKTTPTLYCTGQIYYLKKSQNTLLESFANMQTPEELNPAFLKMVSQLGSVVEVKRHYGWTGNVETSWKTVSTANSQTQAKAKTISEIDGHNSILYWVDLTTEIAFYLPHYFIADNQGSDMRILIVWLEEFRDDLDSVLPAYDQTSKFRDISIIGIHPLKNRLFRISLNSTAQKMQSSCASLPLIDGMVLPIHILAFFLRQTVNNLSRRKRLEDSQSSQTAYSLRKTRITKIIEKYQKRSENPNDFFYNIFFLSNKTPTTNTELVTQSNSMISVQS